MQLSKIFYGVIILFLTKGYNGNNHTLSAQTIHNSSSNSLIKKPRVKPFKSEISFGVRVNTNGWGAFAEYGKYKPFDSRYEDVYYNTNIITLEFAEQKHPRELKRRSEIPGAAEGNNGKYIYAKSNFFYKLKLGYGQRKMIGGKAESNATAINYVYSGGVSLGMLLPYYVKAITPDGTNDIKLTEDSRMYFMDANRIIGRSSITKGIGDMKYLIGAHVRAGINIDFAKKKKGILGLETGIIAEYYTQPITIMETQKAYPYVANIYISAQIGKRMRSKS